MCGRTVSPFPHAHSTSRLIHPHMGRGSTTTPFFIISSHRELGESFFWHSRFSCVCAIHVLGCCRFSFTIGGSWTFYTHAQACNSPPCGLFSFLMQLRNHYWFPHDFGYCGFIFILGLLWVLIKSFWPR